MLRLESPQYPIFSRCSGYIFGILVFKIIILERLEKVCDLYLKGDVMPSQLRCNFACQSDKGSCGYFLGTKPIFPDTLDQLSSRSQLPYSPTVSL
jgi:hypothetical protein